MKNFKEFINENIYDSLQGKSYEYILDKLKHLNDEEKKIEIIKYNLPFELLPRDENGICHIHEDLNIEEQIVEELPNNLHVHGSVKVNFTGMKKIGKNITVDKNFYCCRNNIRNIPKSLKVGNDIFLSENLLTELPKQFTVYGNLDVSENYIKEVPDDLIVHGWFACFNQQYEEFVKIPESVIILKKIYQDSNEFYKDDINGKL